MKDNFFIDSNVALYLLDLNSSRKKEIASSLMKRTPFISSQVFECLNVCTKKLRMSRTLAISFVTQLVNGS
jgi:predicted nucleic acid-binding protein